MIERCRKCGEIMKRRLYVRVYFCCGTCYGTDGKTHGTECRLVQPRNKAEAILLEFAAVEIGDE